MSFPSDDRTAGSAAFRMGGVARGTAWGVLDPVKGPVAATAGTVVSRVGWASPAQIAAARVGVPGTEIPQLWLCRAGERLPPAHIDATVSGAPVRLIRRGGQTLGAVYEDCWGTYCQLTGVMPSNPKAAPGAQATSAFENLESALAEAGMNFSNVARTWLYMDHVLDWYPDLNKARDAFFRSRHVYDGVVPASTGIGSANQLGTAIATCAIAFRAKEPGSLRLTALPSPLQCPALDYGSSFSRAVELAAPDCRRVFVSGTASIRPDSHEVAFVGDIDAQIECTMRAVEAILESRGMALRDVTRALCYLKRPEYRAAWSRWLAKEGLPPGYAVAIVADVCRDAWLFEIEVDAVKEVK